MSALNAKRLHGWYPASVEVKAGRSALAAFVRWLGAEHGFESVDLVGHSMGGLFSRAAIRELRPDGPRVERLVTLGTPWDGAG